MPHIGPRWAPTLCTSAEAAHLVSHAEAGATRAVVQRSLPARCLARSGPQLAQGAQGAQQAGESSRRYTAGRCPQARPSRGASTVMHVTGVV